VDIFLPCLKTNYNFLDDISKSDDRVKMAFLKFS